MLSCERYIDPDCVGNGELTVRNNHIYHVPQALYLKTPAKGPFLISGNVIHDVGSLGHWVPANITFENNLAYDVEGGALVGGHGGIYERNGHNFVLRDNTLLGFDSLVSFVVYASGHTIRGNVIEGLELSVSEGTWNDTGYIAQQDSPYFPDTTADFAASQLARDNDFDDNCFVTAVTDFLAFSRRYDDGGGVESSYLSLEQGRTLMGHETTSDRVELPASVFVDFSGGDYQIDPASPCAGRGASVPPWAR